MREGPQLGVAKAARAPPCTLPILGRRSSIVCQLFSLSSPNHLQGFISDGIFQKANLIGALYKPW
jgi:hypothetical protein